MVLSLFVVLCAAAPAVVVTFDGSRPGHPGGEVRARLDARQNAVALEPGFTIDDTTRFVVSETEVVLEMRVITHLLIDATDADSEADTKVLEKRTSAWLPMIREGAAWRRPSPAPLIEIPAAQLRKSLGKLGPRFAARLGADVEPWSLVHPFEATHELRLAGAWRQARGSAGPRVAHRVRLLNGFSSGGGAAGPAASTRPRATRRLMRSRSR